MTNHTTNKRKSFIIYKDSLSILKKLKDEQAGKLFKTIANYQEEGVLPTDELISIIFEPFLNQFARDIEKYKNTCQARREAGAKGGKQKVANASKCKQKVANLADSDSDSDSKNESKSVSKKNFIAPSLQDVEKYCQERNSRVNPKNFHEYYSAGNWKDSQGNQVKNWKQKLLTWEKKDNIPTQGGVNPAKNEDMAIFINNLCKDTLVNSIIISASNKAVFRFNKREGYEKFMKLDEKIRNEIKQKVSKELGTVGFDINY